MSLRCSSFGLQADQEREWLLKMENLLVNDEIEEEQAGISLNDVIDFRTFFSALPSRLIFCLGV